MRPVFHRGALVGYAANKAHHADVGGSVPGSMPADAPDIFAEGIVVPPLRLVAGDRIVDETLAIFCSNSRTPHERSGDLRAQVAGNYTGERRLLEICDRYGAADLAGAVDRALDNSERRMRAALRALGDGVFEAATPLKTATGGRALRLPCAWSCATASQNSTTPAPALKWTFPSTPSSA